MLNPNPGEVACPQVIMCGNPNPNPNRKQF